MWRGLYIESSATLKHIGIRNQESRSVQASKASRVRYAVCRAGSHPMHSSFLVDLGKGRKSTEEALQLIHHIIYS